jgi:hypothetical protein
MRGNRRTTLAATDETVAAVHAEIAGLRDLDAKGLQRLWRERCGLPPGPGLKGELLRAALAYRQQEQVFGGLSPFTAKRLAQVAKSFAREVGRGRAGPDDSIRPALHRRIKPGSRLIREWRGTVHEVVVLPEGYLWNGAVHASLSTIARTMTGTSWNGWTFFGVDRKARQPKGAGAGDA